MPTIQRILIIRLSSLGDVILTSPIVRNLALTHPHAEIHFVVKKAFAPVFTANPHISSILSPEDFASPDLFIKHLQSLSFDLVVDLHQRPKSKAIAKLFPQPQHITFDKLNWQKWLYVNFHRNTLPSAHIVERMASALIFYIPAPDQLHLDFYIDPLTDISSLIPADLGSYYALAVGAGRATKQIPVELLAQITGQSPYPVVLIGGKQDKAIAEALQSQFPTKVCNTVGLSSLHQTAYIIQHSAFLLTGDTGALHMATALQVPTISLWGSSTTSLGFFPWYGLSPSPPLHFVHEVSGLWCRPCSKIGFDSCPLLHQACMLRHSVSIILLQMQQLFHPLSSGA